MVDSYLYIHYLWTWSNVIYPAPCLVYPHRLQGRLAALLVLYAYVIIWRSMNVCICTWRCCYRKCTQFVSYITYESTYRVNYIYLSGYPCKLQLKYFNVVKSAILISASQSIRHSRQISKQNNNKHKHW